MSNVFVEHTVKHAGAEMGSLLFRSLLFPDACQKNPAVCTLLEDTRAGMAMAEAKKRPIGD